MIAPSPNPLPRGEGGVTGAISFALPLREGAGGGVSFLTANSAHWGTAGGG